jgi:hypothetical protein
VTLRGSGIDLTYLAGVLVNSRQPLPSLGTVAVRFQNPPTGPPPGVAAAEVTDLTMIYCRYGAEVLGDPGNVPEPYIHGVKFWRNQIGVQITNAAPRIENCIFDSNSMGISSGRITNVGNDMEFRYCVFLRNTYGINAANSLEMLVEYNWFEQNGVGIMMGAVGLVTASPVLRNNIYYRNGQGYTGTAVLAGRLTTLLAHETFYANQTGIASMDDTVFGGRSDPDIRNCIIWGNTSADLNGVTQQEIRNSDLSTAVGVPVGPIIGINGIMAVDPGFVDPDRGDLHLSDRSPLIDRGVADFGAIPEVDMDGDLREVGFPDMGADEATSFLVHNRSASRSRELRLVLTARQDAYKVYVLAASLISDPDHGIPFGTRVLPLFPDGTFYSTVGFNGRITGFLGQLNGAGQADVRAFVPDWPWLRGWTVYVAYVTLDPASPHGIKTISNVVAVPVDTL